MLEPRLCECHCRQAGNDLNRLYIAVSARLAPCYSWMMHARDPIAERIADAQAQAAQHAQHLRKLVPELVRVLRRYGAEHVWLFGSLATHKPPAMRTDVDLCVLGLPEQNYFSALADLRDIASVDLVRWETASRSLQDRIRSDGIEVTRDAS